MTMPGINVQFCFLGGRERHTPGNLWTFRSQTCSQVLVTHRRRRQGATPTWQQAFLKAKNLFNPNVLPSFRSTQDPTGKVASVALASPPPCFWQVGFLKGGKGWVLNLSGSFSFQLALHFCGRWDEDSSWPAGHQPRDGDNVTIEEGRTLVLGTTTANLNLLHLKGLQKRGVQCSCSSRAGVFHGRDLPIPSPAPGSKETPGQAGWVCSR